MTYLHLGRQSKYDVLGKVRIQTSRPILDDEELTLYRAQEDGSLWGRHPDEFFDPNRFRSIGPLVIIGDHVTKEPGYSYPGEIRSVFWTHAGERRYVVEATGPGYSGMLHIFNGGQLLLPNGVRLGEPK